MHPPDHDAHALREHDVARIIGLPASVPRSAADGPGRNAGDPELIPPRGAPDGADRAAGQARQVVENPRTAADRRSETVIRAALTWSASCAAPHRPRVSEAPAVPGGTGGKVRRVADAGRRSWRTSQRRGSRGQLSASRSWRRHALLRCGQSPWNHSSLPSAGLYLAASEGFDLATCGDFPGSGSHLGMVTAGGGGLAGIVTGYASYGHGQSTSPTLDPRLRTRVRRLLGRRGERGGAIQEVERPVSALACGS